nr:hypothetical protein [Candidatus Gracilibacteria bacterium]
MNKQEYSGEIKYSSKGVIVDKDGNIYLEKCPALSSKLGLFGGKKEGNETPKETLIRELREKNELGIIISKSDLKVVEVNGPIEFKTGRFVATVFILYISDEVARIIGTRENVVKGKIKDFMSYEEDSFIFSKKDFLNMVERALDYRY